LAPFFLRDGHMLLLLLRLRLRLTCVKVGGVDE
jgi:hypothetical protein